MTLAPYLVDAITNQCFVHVFWARCFVGVPGIRFGDTTIRTAPKSKAALNSRLDCIAMLLDIAGDTDNGGSLEKLARLITSENLGKTPIANFIKASAAVAHPSAGVPRT
jgi:hypothetical protein